LVCHLAANGRDPKWNSSSTLPNTGHCPGHSKKRLHQKLEGQRANCFSTKNDQLTNLQLQPWGRENDAKRKDRIEVKLQCLVFTGQVSLGDAQREIANN